MYKNSNNFRANYEMLMLNVIFCETTSKRYVLLTDQK